MLDFKTQSQLLDATATIMRSYLRAANNTFAASASRGMSLWSEMMEGASPRSVIGARPEPAVHALTPSWPWLAGNAAGISWTPLAQTWWLGPSVTFWAPLAGWRAWAVPAGRQAAGDGPAHAGADKDGGFASYRSSGGHAAAQVIIGTAPGRSGSPKRP